MLDSSAVIDIALEALIPPAFAKSEYGAGGAGNVGIGDLVICREGGRMRYIFYNFLRSNGYTLSKQEKSLYKNVKRALKSEPPFARPCVIVERHSHNSYKVCFLATLEDEVGSIFTDLSIPLGPDPESLTIYPPQFAVHAPTSERNLIIPLPVVRSARSLVPVRRTNFLRARLDYGELERGRKLIREKLEMFATRHEEFRARELAIARDPRHHSNHPKVESDVPPYLPQNVKLSKPHFGFVGDKWLFGFHFKRSPIWRNRSNVRWILDHGQRDIEEMSMFLSNTEPVAPPAFRLPPPVYSSLLRASTTFIRRRIFP
ncbi:hypothetical protein R3P38DRAFT_2953543 [Favolaschia claudopus]|uniref:Uncharacterized protein n=1 Tax=Favolaschia claudopus TaxID=2862362 RepID=A0AAW0BG27_9AGAR